MSTSALASQPPAAAQLQQPADPNESLQIGILTTARKAAIATLIVLASLSVVFLCVFCPVVPAILFSAALCIVTIAAAAALMQPDIVVRGPLPALRTYRPLVIEDPVYVVPSARYVRQAPIFPFFSRSFFRSTPSIRDPHVRLGSGDIYAGRTVPARRDPIFRNSAPRRSEWSPFSGRTIPPARR